MSVTLLSDNFLADKIYVYKQGNHLRMQINLVKSSFYQSLQE